VELWLPQHAKKLQQVAGNYAEFERVQESIRRADGVAEGQPLDVEDPRREREVSVRCFSPPGYIDPEEDLDEEEMK